MTKHQPHYIGNPHGLTFHEVPDSVVILVKGGVYKQSQVYVRGNFLYAKHGSGFAQINTHGTSVPNLRIDGLDIPGVDHAFEGGRMIAKNIEAMEIKAIEHKA